MANDVKKQEKLVSEYVKAIKKVYAMPMSNGTINEENEEYLSEDVNRQ